jgi:hypothetical protein
MKFIIEPYLIDFEVYFTNEPKKVAKNILKRNPDDQIKKELIRDWLTDDGTMASACGGYIKNDYVIISIFDKDAIKDYYESSMAHEAIHVLSYIMKYAGLKYDYDNDEYQAYIVDNVVRMMVKASQ